MTSQQLVPSMCVDYLSHPLSTEHLLVCYQQITRQVAHAPQTPKAAALSFQHQSQLLLDLLGQHHQNLAMPLTKERPAPVGSKAELKRMQNALWRRSAQSSLAKDVPLVRPESLNWQKECDVLWLYGPLYSLGLVPSTDQLDIPSKSPQTNPQSPSLSMSPLADEGASTTRETSSATATPMETISELSGWESASSDKKVSPLPDSSVSFAPHHSTTPTLADSNNSPIINTPTMQSNHPARSMASRPKSALKRQRTKQQVLDELRAFTRSAGYAAWNQALAVSSSGSDSNTMALVEGSQSEPISPITTSPASFILPIFPSPTKYHFRSQDRRRASFPKSASHPNHLNLNVNVNMSVSMQDRNNSPPMPKHLRFSMEVQELVFLQSSPPFRISRAKPTRAHSDPAILSSNCSSFIAPSHPTNEVMQGSSSSSPPLYTNPSIDNLTQQLGNLITTATASGSLYDNTTTTFIKVRAHDFRGLGINEDDIPECGFNDDFSDEYLFEDCREDDDDDEFDIDDGCGLVEKQNGSSRLSAKDGIVARRIQAEDRQRHAPGVFWQVYTAVTGVKELIAWYGSMVYHSSSL
ncbi:hypothetical protein EMPS_02126 [Entomortierella parvispora]|uniref:Nitrogen regulatory protein areA GATA-like domain-containing protein n=1 Tax=Entomortierella parvispora TaxID=205924 RepID=A0A9P3H4V2_9FUNG|nr:hypothetical protein EMPS_02126 [Entomortierella parvispora]